jgi:regulation of enolase protein 1 (concanavalin A-like superfamily)
MQLTLTSTDIGSPALSGSTSRSGNAVTIVAGGADIWGTSDEFHFAHQPQTGDFDLAVRIESLVQTDLYTKAGLMARATLDADSAAFMVLVFASNASRNNNSGGYEGQVRTAAGGEWVGIYPPVPQPEVNFPQTWLRLQRTGDTFIGSSSADGTRWTEFARRTVSLPATLHLGLAVTSHNATIATTAKFHL